MKVSKRGAVPPFYVMEVMKATAEREAAGKDVLHLEVGQSSTSAPQGALDAARAALSEDRMGYADSMGMPELRARIARHYRDFYGVRLPAERICITTGSSGAFLLAFLASMEAGDRIAFAEPGYPAYRNILTSLNIEPVSIPVDAGSRFQPTPEHLDRIKGKLDALLVATPSNPAGTMLDGDALRRLVSYCDQRGMRLIVDEIYHGITFGAPPVTASALSDRVIVINSFSKAFSMTGWRLGWMVVPPDLHDSIERLSQNHFISAPVISQHAGLAAFDCTEEIEANMARYRANRELLLRELPKAGFDNLAPCDGAFYIYADVSRLTNDSMAFCRRMLDEIGVAATPGVDFDPARGHHFVRFSFAGSTEDMAEAARRLLEWVPQATGNVPA